MSEFKNETPTDDPGLTAYALGELEDADAAHYAALVENSPELQALVREIQAEAQLLATELKLEPTVSLSTDRRTAILAQASELPTQATLSDASRRKPWLRWLAVATGTAVAVTGVALSLPKSQRSESEKVLALRKADSARGLRDEAKSAAKDARSVDKAADVSSPVAHRPLSGATDDLAEVRFTNKDAKKYMKADASRTQTLQSLDGIVAGKESPDLAKSDAKSDRESLTATRLRTDAASSESKPTGRSEGFKESLSQSNETARPGEPSGSAGGGNVEDGYVRNFGDEQGQSPGGVPGSMKGKGKSAGPGKEVADHAEFSGDSGLDEAPQGGPSPGNSNGPVAKNPSPGPSSAKPSGDRLKRGDAGEKSEPQEEAREPHGALAVADYDRSDSKPHPGPSKPADASSKGGKQLDALKDSPADFRSKLYSEKAPESTREKLRGTDPLGFQRSGNQSEAKQVALAERSRPEGLSPESRPALKDLEKRESEVEQLQGRERLSVADPTTDEAYQQIFENSFISPAQEQLSTFSIDVDSASFANTRRYLLAGQVPPANAVRIEELINYFSYQYPVPQDGKPFSVNSDIAACPWNPGHHLVRIGLKGKEIPKEQRPPSSLVFLVDVSGSMSAQNKLPLVRESLKTLVGQLDERDRIAIVTYAGEAGVRLPATSVTQRQTILSAIDALGAGGSTNGAAGINTAYDIAAQEFIEKGTNRVILCTDGDFNVGVTSDDALVQMIQTRAKGGVFLSIFGFGMGNLKDAKLEALADKGNGQYGYIDDRQEAEKVFVQELSGTLVTIAKDVKIQIDFNKEAVEGYRLIGYENRILAAEDFHDDKKDAGEIGAGHTVTALYEIVPAKDLKVNDQTRWMTVKLRYKQPEASTSELIENPLLGQPGQLKLASSDFQFAASVASFGMLLRNSRHAGQANWGMVKELAQSGLSNDPHGHRSGFRRLVDQAESLMGERRPSAPPEPDSTVNGKYKSLLRRLNVPEDAQQYGQFRDFGFDKTKSYGGADNLPEGYWVYVAPYWYIWGEQTQATPK